MGVPGLWDVLRPAGQQKSLAQLAVQDGFERNPGGRRGLRVGIDASIWFFHATYGREGENPELRTLFFRCARLMTRPFLPVFVFDGPKRPELKRKKKISGKDHWMVSGMQEIIEAFGFEWWFAPGEAEAELAYLNKIGVIDAIITDDVDTFLFGATTIIRNNGKLLSGNSAHPVKNTAGRDDSDHTYTYASSDILEHPDISLSQDGLILIALLCGGDYDSVGLDGCGTSAAHALARCGFGDTLLDATRNLPRARLPAFLDGWRSEVRAELRSNARGFLRTKKLKLSKTLPDTFPDIEVLQLYSHPETSERKNKRPEFRWDREPDLMKLAALCERKFEWGVRDIIIKRFRTVMWAPIVLRIMRRAVLNSDAVGPSTPRKKKGSEDKPIPPGTPSKMITENFSSLSLADEDDTQRLIVAIHGRREHASTDGMLEYRLEVNPGQLVRLTAAGVQGHRVLPTHYEDSADEDDCGLDDDPEGKKGMRKKGGPKCPPPDPGSHLRIWIPACIVERVEPTMVAAYEGRLAQKERDKEEKAARKATRAAGGAKPKAQSRAKASPSRENPRKPSAKLKKKEEEEEELSAEEDFSLVFDLQIKSKSKIPTSVTSKSVRVQPRPTLSVHDEEQEEEEEEEVRLPRPWKERSSRSKATPLSEATNNLAKQAETKSKSRSGALQMSLQSATELSKRKTILDLLDESTTRFASTTASVSLPVKTSSEGLPPMAPRPFPMSLPEKGDGTGEQENLHVPKQVLQERNSSKAGARQFSTRILESDDSCSSARSSPKKSPRKNKNHISPSSKSRSAEKINAALKPQAQREADIITDSDDGGQDVESDIDTRPASPSPLRPRMTATLASSNRGALTKSPGSIRRARTSARVPFSAPAVSASTGQPSKSRPIEVIEITSGSESEQDKPRTFGSIMHSTQSLKKKPAVPSATKQVGPGKTTSRVDTIFPIIKSKPVAKQKKGLSKRLNASARNHQPTTLNMNDVIEIL